MMKAEMGSSVEDVVTGFKGVVVGFVTYITGCNQYLVQPRVKDNSDFVDSRWIDEDRVKVLSFESVVALPRTVNGPDKTAPRR